MYRAIITAAAVLATAAIIATTPAAGSESSQGHWCRQGDPALYASIQTTCQLAGNIITAYVSVCHETAKCQLRVNRPASLKCSTHRESTGLGARDAGKGLLPWHDWHQHLDTVLLPHLAVRPRQANTTIHRSPENSGHG